jgi:hypothetical protein
MAKGREEDKKATENFSWANDMRNCWWRSYEMELKWERIVEDKSS